MYRHWRAKEPHLSGWECARLLRPLSGFKTRPPGSLSLGAAFGQSGFCRPKERCWFSAGFGGRFFRWAEA